MQTTKNGVGIPRILVKLSAKSKLDLLEKEIITTTGEKIKLCLKAPSYEEVDKYELSVKVGEVIALSPGVKNVQIGDIALIDYIVDADAEYVAYMEGNDKVVSVPCQSRIHDKDIVVTSYYQQKKIGGTQGEKKIKMEYTGEKNVFVARKGDVDEISLLLGVIRDGQLIPNDYFIFCEPKQENSNLTVQANGLFGFNAKETTHIKRRVLFSSPETGLKSGDYVLAEKESNFELTVFEKKFDVIAVVDVLAID